MSNLESSVSKLSSTTHDRASSDATCTSSSPQSSQALPLFEPPIYPKPSLKTCPDQQKPENPSSQGFPVFPQVDGSLNVPKSFLESNIGCSPKPSKEVIDISHDPHDEPEKRISVERPPFAPFFTIIKTGETIAHPRQVHYLFSDDDTSEVLTSSLLRSLFGAESSCTSLMNSVDLEISNKETILPANNKSSKANPISRPRKDSNLRSNVEEIDGKAKQLKPEERVIIVDLNSTGDGVASVNSLSSKWQVLNAQIEKAPTWNGAEDAKTSDANDLIGNMMLKIDGIAGMDLSADTLLSTGTATSATRFAVSRGVANSFEMKQDLGEEEMQNLLESFDQKIAILRRVMGKRSRLDSQDTIVESDGRRRIEEN